MEFAFDDDALSDGDDNEEIIRPHGYDEPMQFVDAGIYSDKPASKQSGQINNTGQQNDTTQPSVLKPPSSVICAGQNKTPHSFNDSYWTEELLKEWKAKEIEWKTKRDQILANPDLTLEERKAQIASLPDPRDMNVQRKFLLQHEDKRAEDQQDANDNEPFVDHEMLQRANYADQARLNLLSSNVLGELMKQEDWEKLKNDDNALKMAVNKTLEKLYGKDNRSPRLVAQPEHERHQSGTYGQISLADLMEDGMTINEASQTLLQPDRSEEIKQANDRLNELLQPLVDADKIVDAELVDDVMQYIAQSGGNWKDYLTDSQNLGGLIQQVEQQETTLPDTSQRYMNNEIGKQTTKSQILKQANDTKEEQVNSAKKTISEQNLDLTKKSIDQDRNLTS